MTRAMGPTQYPITRLMLSITSSVALNRRSWRRNCCLRALDEDRRWSRFEGKPCTRTVGVKQTRRFARLAALRAYGGGMFAAWWGFSTDAAMLAVEAQSVVAMRMTDLALGRGTMAESSLMMTEKVAALLGAAITLATGGSPHKVVRGYRRTVLANGR